MSLLNFSAFKEFAEKDYIFDFEGSMIPGVARFFKGFGDIFSADGGGYTGSINFVQGDVPQGGIAEDFRFFSYALNNPNNFNLGAIAFPDVISQNSTYSTWTAVNTKYTAIDDPSNMGITLYFKVFLSFPFDNYDFTGNVQFFKNGVAQGVPYQIGYSGQTAFTETIFFQDPSATLNACNPKGLTSGYQTLVSVSQV